jgi:multidrug efflux pump subunit AcrA (membrane-fusion protein)
MPVETVTEDKVTIQGVAPQNRKSGKAKHWVAAIVVAAAVIGALTFGILPRVTARTTLRNENAQMALPTVAVIHPERTAQAEEVVLPANVQAFISAPIYARTNGYLKKWYADIGAHVKQGQLLAEIETPEVDQQLQQARGKPTATAAIIRENLCSL